MLRLVSFAACVSASLADIVKLRQDPVSVKEQVISALSEHGSAALDASITDEMAQDILAKFVASNDGSRTRGRGRRRELDSKTWSTSDKQVVLDMHNTYRSTVATGKQSDDGSDGTYPTSANMNYLFWDDALASLAQSHSDTCSYGHNNNRADDFASYSSSASFDYESGSYLGENIAAYWTSSDAIEDKYLTERVDAWWDEYNLWHYQDYQSSTINGAGHFTQMAWADTRYVGCGFTWCDDGWNMWYLVCNYYPGGNYIGQYPYDKGTASSSTCDADRTRTNCDDGLCGGCMDPGFVSSGSTSDASDCNDGFESVSGSCGSGTVVTDTNTGTGGSGTDTNTNTGGSGTDTNTGGSGTDTNTGTVSSVECGSYECVYIGNLGWFSDEYWTYQGCYDDHGYYSSDANNGKTTYLYWASYYSEWTIYETVGSSSYYAYCHKDSVTDCNGGNWYSYDGGWGYDSDATTNGYASCTLSADAGASIRAASVGGGGTDDNVLIASETDARSDGGTTDTQQEDTTFGDTDDDGTDDPLDEFTDRFTNNCTHDYGNYVCLYNDGSLWDTVSGIATFGFDTCKNDMPMFSYRYTNPGGNYTVAYILHYDEDEAQWEISKNSNSDDDDDMDRVAYCMKEDVTECTYKTWYIVSDDDDDSIDHSMGYDEECQSTVTDDDAAYCDQDDSCAMWSLALKIEDSTYSDESASLCDDMYVACVSVALSSDVSSVDASLNCHNSYEVYVSLNVSFTRVSGYSTYSDFLANYETYIDDCDDDNAADLTAAIEYSHLTLCSNCEDFVDTESTQEEESGQGRPSMDRLSIVSVSLFALFALLVSVFGC